MTGVVKFTFDQNFEKPSEGQAARLEKEACKYTDMELETAARQAFAEGHTAGLAEARADAEEAIVKALEAAADALAGLSQGQQTAVATQRQEAVELACLIARKLAPTLISRWPLEEIEALVGECLAVLHEEPRVVVRVNEVLLDGLKDRLDGLSQRAGFAGQIVLLPDDAIAPEGCRVEWADGGADWDPTQLAATIEAKVARHVQAVAAAATAHSDREAAADTASPAETQPNS